MNKRDAFMIALLDAPTTKEAYTRAGVAPRTSEPSWLAGTTSNAYTIVC